MFEEFINMMLENEREVISSRQEENTKAEPDVIEEKTATEIKIPKKYQNDIDTLREMYGESFKTGLCINLTLNKLWKSCREKEPGLMLIPDLYHS